MRLPGTWILHEKGNIGMKICSPPWTLSLKGDETRSSKKEEKDQKSRRRKETVSMIWSLKREKYRKPHNMRKGENFKSDVTRKGRKISKATLWEIGGGLMLASLQLKALLQIHLLIYYTSLIWGLVENCTVLVVGNWTYMLYYDALVIRVIFTVSHYKVHYTE